MSKLYKTLIAIFICLSSSSFRSISSLYCYQGTSDLAKRPKNSLICPQRINPLATSCIKIITDHALVIRYCDELGFCTVSFQ